MTQIRVVAIIEHDGKILIGKKSRCNHVLSGAWHIPGGKLEENETEKHALIREMLEETGVKISVDKFIDEINYPNTDIFARWYLCSPITFDLKPGDDLKEVKFIPKYEVTKVCQRATKIGWPPKVIEYFKRN